MGAFKLIKNGEDSHVHLIKRSKDYIGDYINPLLRLIATLETQMDDIQNEIDEITITNKITEVIDNKNDYLKVMLLETLFFQSIFKRKSFFWVFNLCC